MNSVLRLQGEVRGEKRRKEKKKKKAQLNLSCRECFLSICSGARGWLFFRTGSSGETFPFVPDGPGIPPL
jgi:hypothetical protein